MAMKIRTIKLYFKEGFYGIFRNRLMSLAAVATIAACLFIVGISYCVAINLDFMLETLEKTMGVTVFLEKDITMTQIEQMHNRIKQIPHVTEVKYISPKQALDEFQRDLGEQGGAGVLEGLELDNPLSPSFEISLTNAKYQRAIIESLSELQGVKKIKHAQSEAEILMGINRMLRIISLILVGILSIIGIIIIMNTIKITVYIRRYEINIMKYIGATDWFIRWPFVIEGILIGLIGACIPIFIIWASYGFVIQLIYDKFTVIQNLFVFRQANEIFPALLPIAIAMGGIIGMIGSTLSVRKHLRV